MSKPVDTADYEKNRINQNQEKWLYLQKKTFTKWMNSFLSKVRTERQQQQSTYLTHFSPF